VFGVRFSRTTALVFGLVISRPLGLSAQDDVGIPIGSTPAAAQVQDTSGATVDLSRHVGRRPVVVEFWATWCEVCEALLPRMEAAQRRYGAQVDFVVIGVGVNQSLNTMKRHIRRHPQPFTFYFDPRGAAVRAFQAPATGVVFALDAQGKVVYAGAGADQNIEEAARRAVRRLGG
jgi:cytochrome c biogenesis protein CcmG/thiol:disulfide interchange protein DsbE